MAGDKPVTEDCKIHTETGRLRPALVGSAIRGDTHRGAAVNHGAAGLASAGQTLANRSRGDKSQQPYEAPEALTRSDSKSFALIIVMLAITVLSILAAGFAYSMKVETKLAQNANSETELLWLGRSGVERACWILAQELRTEARSYDSLNQIWAGGPGEPGSSNSPLAGISLNDYHLGDGKFSLKITDLERKANINTADEAMLQQVLTRMGVEAGEVSTIANSILDWIDPDDIPRIGGAESSYYKNLDPPYYAKNAPIDDLSELLLVKGVTPDIYWGGVISNHPPAAFQNRLGLLGPNANMPPLSVGLVDLFTPLSSGKININTASAEVLQMVPMIDQNVAAGIIDFRNQGEGLEGPQPIGSNGKSIPDALVNAGLSQGAAQQAASFFDVRSQTFEVRVDAEIAGYRRQFVAILGRKSPRDVQVLSFYWK